MDILEFFYYIFSFVNMILFFYFLKKLKLSIFSLTTISFIISFIVVVLPGYYIASGEYFKEFNVYYGFNYDIYLIYFLFSFLFPFSILIGRTIGKNFYIDLNFKNENIKIVNYTFIFFIVVILFLIVKIGYLNIPIINLLVNNDLKEAMLLKFEMRTNSDFLILDKSLKISVFFFMIYFYFYYVQSKLSENFYYIKLLLSFFILLFLLSIKLGRDDIVQFLFILIFVKSFVLKKSIKSVIIPALGLSFIMIILWVSLSHYEQTTNQVIKNIFYRVISQTSFTYVQAFVTPETLGIEGIKMPLFGKLLGQDFISPSKEAYNYFYNSEVGYGTAGLSLAQLYFILGIFAFFIFIILIAIIAFIDQIFLQSIEIFKVNKKETISLSFIYAIYLTFVSYFYIHIISNIYSLFSFPHIFSFSLFLFFGLFLFLLKFKIKLVYLKG